MKPFADVKYTCYFTSATNGSAYVPVLSEKTTTSMTFENAVAKVINSANWYACGQGA